MGFRRWETLKIFSVCFGTLLVLHGTLLRLPYFWDEAGYYVPAARDILLRGSLIPLTTVSNAHPPLVMIWLAAAWKVLGYSTWVTRTAMLVVAAFSLTGLYKLAARAANPVVAFYTIALTALYPVFFAQSSLGHVDLAAAGLTFWGLAAYLEQRPRAMAFWFCLAVLAKETALLTPAVLGVWEVCGFAALRWPSKDRGAGGPWHKGWAERLWAGRSGPGDPRRRSAWLLAALASPLLPLSYWYAFHFAGTGYVFGNPEFVRYNVTATLSVTRVAITMVLRVWQVVGYMHLWLLTIAMVAAMALAPRRDGGVERPRISIAVQMVLLLIVVAYVVAMSVIGGAVLARYMLTAVPLVILVAVSTIWRRVPWWRAVLTAVGVAFIVAWWWNPPHGFSPEDNLTYRDFVVLHQDADRYLAEHAHGRPVLTAWPAYDELRRPWLGYISQPVPVIKIENFSEPEIAAAAAERDRYGLALVFSTKYEAHPWNLVWPAWEAAKARMFDYHEDVTPAVAAQKLGGSIVFSEQRGKLWFAVIEIEHVELAGAAGAIQP